MKVRSRWMLVGVLVANALIAMFLIGGAAAPPVAARTPAGTSMDSAADPSRDALLKLGKELAERAEKLAQREADFEELRRGEEVRLRAGLTAAADDSAGPVAEPAVEPAAAEAGKPVQERDESPADEAFKRLSRAYENMEPDSAALALNELAEIDMQAVVQLLVGWPPRTSGGILDSLTQINPGLAAKLSYEIWKRSGKPMPLAADSDR